MDEKPHMVRHFLAALAYRFHKAVEGAPDGFEQLDAGHGIRSPLAIVHHMNGVLGYARVVLESGDLDYWHEIPQLGWREEVALAHQTLQAIDAILAAGSGIDPERLERLLQGPLADSMTHVGQLAMLRRVAGSPIHAENFYKADIRAGQVGEAQPEPISPDP